MQDLKALGQRWFDEVWNKGSEDSVDEILAAHAVIHGIGESEPDLRGPEGFKPFLRNMRASFPDLRMAVEHTVQQEEWVAHRMVMEGTHTGHGLGVPPTGRRVRVSGMSLARVVDGQIVEAWNNWDQLGLLRQIGALPSPEAPDRFVQRSA